MITFEERIQKFFESQDTKLISINLLEIQRTMFKLKIRPLVGFRTVVGKFMADTYVYDRNKWERIFSPFSFNTYEEALKYSIEQALNYYNI